MCSKFNKYLYSMEDPTIHDETYLNMFTYINRFNFYLKIRTQLSVYFDVPSIFADTIC